MRKMTGKASELAAILSRLPLDRDFFQILEGDLVARGTLGADNGTWVREQLGKLPLRVTQDTLRDRLAGDRQWFIEQLMETHKLAAPAATEKADATMDALLAGWRDPTLRRATPEGEVIEETGAPLRAIVAYLFGEVAKNFFLIHHPHLWIEYVSRSQLGDRCFDIAPEQLPTRDAMMGELPWEKSTSGAERLAVWLERFQATAFDYNRDLDDASLSQDVPLAPHRWRGSNFFRGLALIDLAEAMLKRAFGAEHVALRINAAGQGDFFQIHIDTQAVAVEEVKQFVRHAFYRRFDLAPRQEFVEPFPGGGAVGVRLNRFDRLGDLVRALREKVAARE
jgi:hypothetical protein